MVLCAFKETDVKRALRATRAAAETPARIVVTREGFAIELAQQGELLEKPRAPSAYTSSVTTAGPEGQKPLERAVGRT
jgi:hypothetical protein